MFIKNILRWKQLENKQNLAHVAIYNRNIKKNDRRVLPCDIISIPKVMDRPKEKDYIQEHGEVLKEVSKGGHFQQERASGKGLREYPIINSFARN